MDLDYRRIGGKGGGAYGDFEMALTVLTTVISVPSNEIAMIDAGAEGVLHRQALRAGGGRVARGSSTRGRAMSAAASR